MIIAQIGIIALYTLNVAFAAYNIWNLAFSVGMAQKNIKNAKANAEVARQNLANIKRLMAIEAEIRALG